MQNNWIKLAIKAIVLIVLLCCIDRIVGFGFDKVRNKLLESNPEYKTLKVNYVVEKANSDILVVGASTASRHYIPQEFTDSLGLSVYNCGLDGCYLLFQCCMINTVLDRYQPKCILWEVGYQCLAPRTDEFDHVDYLYPYYTNPYCKEYINKSNKYQHLYMLSKMYRNNSDVDKYMQAMVDKETFDNGFWPLYDDGHHPESIAHDKKYDDVDAMKVSVLKETLDRLKEMNVQVFFVQSPQYHDGAAKQSKSYEQLRVVLSEYGMTFLDYGEKLKEPEYYRDAEHLNIDGATAFMKIIIPDLKRVIVSPK